MVETRLHAGCQMGQHGTAAGMENAGPGDLLSYELAVLQRDDVRCDARPAAHLDLVLNVIRPPIECSKLAIGRDSGLRLGELTKRFESAGPALAGAWRRDKLRSGTWIAEAARVG
jgi:hypothetical protein